MGGFIVKTTYQLACSINRGNVSTAESSRGREERGRMWKLPVKPKLKHFLW